MEKRLSGRKYFLFAVLTVFFLSYFLPASICAENEILLDGTGIFLTSGETWKFDQGYQLKVKSVNPSDNRAWVELSLNGEIIQEEILGEGETLVYYHNKEILNITLDTIYSSPTGELVTFKPVYQYLDPELPEPESHEDAEEKEQDDNKPGIAEDENTQPIPGFGIFFTIVTFVIVTFCLYKNSKNRK